MDIICNLYYSAFDKEQLVQLLSTNFDVVAADGAMHIIMSRERVLSVTRPGAVVVMSQVARLLQFIPVIPTTNST